MDIETIEALQIKIKQDLRVSLPGVIKSYDYKKQMADIDFSPELLSDNNINPLKGISGVPVVFPRSGGASITMPVKVGDGCIVVFLDRDARRWLEGNPKDKPYTRRMHSFNDAIAFVGLTPFSAPSAAINNTDLHIQYSGSNITLKPDGLIEIHSAKKIDVQTKNIGIKCSEAVVVECQSLSIKTANNTTLECANLNIKGQVQVDGSITSNATITGQNVQTSGGIGLAGHAHEYTNPKEPSPSQPGTTTNASGGAVANQSFNLGDIHP